MDELFKQAYDAKKVDDARYWLVFSLMTGINGALVAALSFAEANAWMTGVVAFFGVAVCAVWLLIQRRYADWSFWWAHELELLEKPYIEELNKRRSNLTLAKLPDEVVVWQDRELTKFNDKLESEGKHRLVSRGVSTREGGWYMALVFILGWLGVAVYVGTGVLVQRV